MYKLKYKMINKMINKKISSKEIDFILLLTQSLTSLGQARDIHYKEVCMNLDISKQAFYDIIENLDCDGLINPTYQNKPTWDFTLTDNIFLTENDFKDSYLNTNRDFLYSKDFRDLKANEKLLILKLLILTNNNSFKISFDNLKKWFDIKCNSVILSYIESIKKWFYVSFDNNIFCFSYKGSTYVSNVSAKSKTFINRLKRWCLKYKIGFTASDLTDIYNLYYMHESGLSKFFSILVDTSFRYRILKPAVINFCLLT